MLLTACLRRYARLLYWIPVTIIIMVVMWSYYAYVVHFCWMVFLCLFHICFGMFSWSFWKTLSTPPSSPSVEFQLSSSDSLLYEQERGSIEKSQILLEISQKLPVHTRTATGAIRFCHHCQLIKPDRCHHCSVCQMCVLKMDHHCPWLNNCIGFSNYKFFMLFLLYSLLYCLLIVSTVTPTFIQLWLGKLFDSCAKLHVLFLTLVSAMFAVTLWFLLVFHIWLLASNKTTLEWLSVPFFADGPASEAFDVGVRANFLQVFGKNKILWPFPVFSRGWTVFPLEMADVISLSFSDEWKWTLCHGRKCGLTERVVTTSQRVSQLRRFQKDLNHRLSLQEWRAALKETRVRVNHCLHAQFSPGTLPAGAIRSPKPLFY